MREISVNGQKRTETGKKASKLLRKEGLVPCNLYGESKDDKNLLRHSLSLFLWQRCVR